MDFRFPSSSQLSEPISHWPVFGPKNTFKRFWTPKPQKLSKDCPVLFEGELQRIGKNKVKPKAYYYKITKENLLLYFKKQSDLQAKGSLILNENILIKLSQFDYSKDQRRIGIKLYKSDKVHLTLLSEKSSLIFELWELLVKQCVINNFDEMYQPFNILGKGSFATVYKVKRNLDDGLFAAKVYYKDTLNSSQHKFGFVQMIQNETRILRQLNHPHIVKLHQVFQMPDKVVLLMDYVEGPDLYQLIKRKKNIQERNAALLIAQIASGLNHLSDCDFVHRDIKLENILLCSNEEYNIKIVDFGFAEKINHERLESKQGTPGYIPPELFHNKPFLANGDIFSLGVILHCLISGISPFNGRSYRQIMEANKKAVLLFEKPVWRTISTECKQLIQNMCEANPMERFSAAQVLADKWIRSFSADFELGKRNEISQFLVIICFEQQNKQVQSQAQFEDFLCPENRFLPSFYQRSNQTLKSGRQSIQSQNHQVQEENLDSANVQMIKQYILYQMEIDSGPIDSQRTECLHRGLQIFGKQNTTFKIRTTKNNQQF